jgi:hypothetical protein
MTFTAEAIGAMRTWSGPAVTSGKSSRTTGSLPTAVITAARIRTGDSDLALNLLLGAALRCWWADTGPAARTQVVEVTGLLEQDASSDPRYVAALGVAEPVLEGRHVIEMLSRVVIESVTDART